MGLKSAKILLNKPSSQRWDTSGILGLAENNTIKFLGVDFMGNPALLDFSQVTEYERSDRKPDWPSCRLLKI